MKGNQLSSLVTIVFSSILFTDPIHFLKFPFSSDCSSHTLCHASMFCLNELIPLSTIHNQFFTLKAPTSHILLFNIIPYIPQLSQTLFLLLPFPLKSFIPPFTKHLYSQKYKLSVCEHTFPVRSLLTFPVKCCCPFLLFLTSNFSIFTKPTK